MGGVKCDHIKRLITLTSDKIKRLTLYNNNVENFVLFFEDGSKSQKWIFLEHKGLHFVCEDWRGKRKLYFVVMFVRIFLLLCFAQWTFLTQEKKHYYVHIFYIFRNLINFNRKLEE